MFRATRKYHMNGGIPSNGVRKRTYDSDMISPSESVISMSSNGNALFHVVGSRKDMEINQLSGKLEDEQSLVVQLQRKIKELQVRKILASAKFSHSRELQYCFWDNSKLFTKDSKKNVIKDR